MTKYLTNNPSINLYKKPSKKSEVVTQMIFGERFAIRNKKMVKIRIKEDGYKGYIKKKFYSNFKTNT